MQVNTAVDQQSLMQCRLHPVLVRLTALLTLLLATGAAAETRFDISAVKVNLVDKVYYLNARIDYELSDKVVEVMHKGVPVVVVLDIKFQRKRRFIWNEEIAELVQRYQLEYHALTRQYLVTNLNSGSQHSFPTLEVALTLLGTVVDLPVLDRQLLEEEGEYIGLMRVSVDAGELPAPLRLRAYFSADWHLSSEWYSWTLPN
ncbi:MAG TPA: DUF4390 domain-containing protein [Chromatiales bacterium]|nr:DUF4390 domain-containing protein [Chromatiales bacterium]